MRVVSVVAVVVGHAWPFMPGEEYVQIWRMPLFFFLAGYFLSAHRDVVGEFALRFRTLGIPYLSWLMLLIFAVWALDFSPWPLPSGTVQGALSGGADADMPFLSFWFISVMFFAALLLRLLLLAPWWVGVMVALGGLALAEAPDSAMAYTFLGMGLVPACTSYMLAGYWFRRLIERPRFQALPAHWALGLIAVCAGLIGVAAGAETMNMKWSGFGTFLISPVLAVLIVSGLVLIFSTVVNALLAGLPAAAAGISELVRAGTMVVFLHPLVLYVLTASLGLEGPLVKSVITLAICWSLAPAVNRTPLRPLLTGVPRLAPERISPRTPHPATAAAAHR